MRPSITVALILACVSLSLVAHAQSDERNQEQAATYVSQLDEDLTIRRVAVLPVVDNVDGIYARPVEARLTELVKKSHRWDFVETGIAGAMPSLIDMEENPDQVLQVTRSLDADAFVAAAVSKGPAGLSIRVDLFLKKDGKLLSQEILKDHPRYELAEIRDRVSDLYRRTVARIPYDGILLSRQGNRVTVNLGKGDGLAKDQVITVVQIISIKRHPKFNFIVSSEKEILGRVKILKVDETLSFGAIVSEKERGAIRRFAKVSGLEQVNYSEPEKLGDGAGQADINARPDATVALGKNPREWLPVRTPSFGEVGMELGLGSYNGSANLGSTGTFEEKSSIYPLIGLHGELWLTPQYTVRAELMQGVISADNPRSGSKPSTLNHALSRYSLEFGYNVLLRDDFFGPKIGVSLGYASYRLMVDDTTPTAMTTTTYSGMLVGLNGSFPVTDDKSWYVGGKLNLWLFSSIEETPVTSGADAKSSTDEFSIFVQKKIAENLRASGGLNFALYSTSFTGQGSRTGPNGPEAASTLSERHTTLTGGITYMF